MASAVWMTERTLASDCPTSPPKETAGVELQQGHTEDTGGGLGGERLAGAGDAEDEHPLGTGSP